MSKYLAMCPVCGACAAPEIFLAEAVKREAIAKALRMPAPLAMQIQVYIGLFRPPKRGQSIDRVERLLADLLVPIEAGKVRRKGRDWPAPISVWMSALDQVIARRDKLTLPLKDHAYLFEVVAGHADKVEADAERKQEEQRKHRKDSTPKQPINPMGYDPQKAWEQQMKDLGQEHLIPGYEKGGSCE